uniref:Uncharacterized protein n=1 Tax=Tetradesmus obliquus TaxID=3088 RepID=A0A383WDS8_TETOB|eukprot:jgi/Sobl393_1/5864/SZX75765.1
MVQQAVQGDTVAVLAGYTLFRPPATNYTAFRGSAWSRSQWGSPCRKLLPRLAAAGTKQTASSQLCALPSIWKDCSQGIYLDIGTNVGVQLRKLYDPQQFPGAAVLPIFDRVFGNQRSGVCAIGVEANPHHTQYLQTLNSYFKQRGYQALILTEVAASVHSGTASFFLDADSPVEWGASLTHGKWQKNSKVKAKVRVQLLDLLAIMTEVVRPILHQEFAATAVMKLDVEGEEYALFPGLLLSGGLCDLNVLFLEPHREEFRGEGGVKMQISEMEEVFAKMRKANPHCTVKVTDLDDESYLDGKAILLPEVQQLRTSSGDRG